MADDVLIPGGRQFNADNLDNIKNSSFENLANIIIYRFHSSTEMMKTRIRQNSKKKNL